MQKLEGKSVFGGIAIGKVVVYSKADSMVARKHVEDTQKEIQRFEDAKEEAKNQLAGLYDKALKEVGEENAAIFEVHQMMLDDLDYIESITHIITSETVNAEYAVACTSDNFSEMFASMDDDYMRARAADIKDISNRIINILQGRSDVLLEGNDPVIIAADDLAPSETVQLDKSKVLSFVTRKGSTNSHTAILARTMNIPALIGIDFPEDVNGKTAIVDGYAGAVYIEPDEAMIEEYKEKRQKDIDKKKMLLELKGKPNKTVDGREIMLYANIGGVSDVAAALANDAAGIGLFRSEFLYLESNDYPTEDEQFIAYQTVARNMAGKRTASRFSQPPDNHTTNSLTLPCWYTYGLR